MARRRSRAGSLRARRPPRPARRPSLKSSVHQSARRPAPSPLAMSQLPPANRMMLQMYKARFVGAKKGHGLLKKKRDALKTKFQAMLKEIVEVKKETAVALKDSAFSFAKAQWACAGEDITATVLERARAPSITCKLYADNIAGVMLPCFKANRDPTKDSALSTLSIAHGGAVVNACREAHAKMMLDIIRLASLQTAFKTLDEEIKMTSRRVNALEYVIMPRIEFICNYIVQEMDEQAREEFFRVKKVVEKKKVRVAAEKLADELYNAEIAKRQGKAAPSPPAAVAAAQAPSMLDEGQDPDIVVG